MATRSNPMTCVILLLLGCTGVMADSGEEGASPTYRVADFTRPRLLARFDADQDGQLNAAEQQRMRAAFDGINVPLLPATPSRYTLAPVTNDVLASALRPLDNTAPDNPLSDSGATLGRVLFYDTQLSKNNTVACASCHPQKQAFADPRRFSVGFNGGLTGRNAMGLGYARFTLINRASPGFFWDERAATLEDQVLMPIQDKIEMGLTLHELEEKLRRLPYYPPLFDAAFGSPEVTSPRIANAVAQFMRSMASFDSKFDRAAAAAGTDYSRDFDDFTAEENLGKSLFINGVGDIAEIGCTHCHVPPTFGMPKAFNNGLDARYADQGLGARSVPVNDPFTPSNDGKFKASSLRNIALTSPYMHDGRFATLEQVVDHYSDGVHPHVNLELAFNEATPPANRQGTSGFRLTQLQKSALIAFMKTLTDEALMSDAKFSDPFPRPEG